MDRLYTMAIFVAVVDEGGFAPAARKLNISPPVVTRAISDLEDSMGVRLLTRTTRIVTTTDAGARYVDDCRRILADVAEAEQAALGLHAEPRGRLVVTAPVMFGQMHVAPVVTAYLTRHPGTEVECRFLDRIVNLMEEGIDVAVRLGKLADSSFHAREVGRVRHIVCAAPAYLERHGKPTVPEALDGHVVIQATGITATSDWRFQEDGEARTVRVTPRLVVNSNEAAMRAARDGFGITRILSYMAAPSLRDGSLVALLSDYAPPPLPVSVVNREGRRSSAKVRTFVDLAASTLRSALDEA
ncbi:LysR family transcriptional regulator [Oxalobacteraceae bacterium OM1]|nr:LysR family transcriptional regulator [Oxalobacteraceae bacterium OM1]